jgi:hypothetical protein
MYHTLMASVRTEPIEARMAYTDKSDKQKNRKQTPGLSNQYPENSFPRWASKKEIQETRKNVETKTILPTP